MSRRAFDDQFKRNNTPVTKVPGNRSDGQDMRTLCTQNPPNNQRTTTIPSPTFAALPSEPSTAIVQMVSGAALRMKLEEEYETYERSDAIKKQFQQKGNVPLNVWLLFRCLSNQFKHCRHRYFPPLSFAFSPRIVRLEEKQIEGGKLRASGRSQCNLEG